MTDQIRPRIIDGVGWCDAGCPQIVAGDDWSRCRVDDRYVYPSDPSPCHVHARRVAAERDSYRSALIELRLRLHATGRRPEECYEMSIIDDALRNEEDRHD